MKKYTISEWLGMLRTYSTFILIAVIFFFIIQNSCQQTQEDNSGMEKIDLLISTQEDKAILLEEKIKSRDNHISEIEKSFKDTLKYYEEFIDIIRDMSSSQQHNYILTIIGE